MKDFRVLTYMDTTMDVTNQRVAVFEVGEVEYMEVPIGSGILPLSKMNGPTIVIDFNSTLTRELIVAFQEEKIVQIDLAKFSFIPQLMNGREDKIGYHITVPQVPLNDDNSIYENLYDSEYFISFEFNQKLEMAFENYKRDFVNPLVISHLRSFDNAINFYVIAKDPKEGIFFGIPEADFIDSREIRGMTESNLRMMNMREIPISPFRARPYIESGLKE